MAQKYKPILIWSLIDVAIAVVLVLIAVPNNLLGIVGFAILGTSALFKLIFAALA